MKAADDYSLKLNLKLMNIKICSRKRLSCEIDNRINQFKVENKTLYNLELDLINKILQFEKKVGELAQNKNCIASNSSKIRDEIPLIFNKIQIYRNIVTKIITNNEKKNIFLNRILYQVKNVNLKLSEYLNERNEKESDTCFSLNNSHNMTDSCENPLRCSIFKKHNTSDAERELTRISNDLKSLMSSKVESLKKVISYYRSDMNELESAKAIQQDNLRNYISSLKESLNVKTFFCENEIENLKENFKENSEMKTNTSYLENILRKIINNLEQGLNEFPLGKINEVENNIKILEQILIDNEKFYLQEKQRTMNIFTSKKINVKIVSKQIEHLIQKKNANILKKRYVYINMIIALITYFYFNKILLKIFKNINLEYY